MREFKNLKALCQRSLQGRDSLLHARILALLGPYGNQTRQAALVLVIHGLEKLVFPRVVAAVDLGQAVGHHVRVPDGRFDAPVPEELLHVPYAGAVLKEMRRGGMAKGVRRYLGPIHVETSEEFAVIKYFNAFYSLCDIA